MFKSKWSIPAIGAIMLVIVGAVIFFQEKNSESTSQSEAELISPAEYQSQFGNNADDFLLIDVRTPEEFASGHLAGAVNIPVDQLEARLSEVSDDRPIVVYCRSGNRSHTASLILEDAGYSSGIYDIDGGVIAWSAAGFQFE
jgi:rhodanese-related sulfurtransferase